MIIYRTSIINQRYYLRNIYFKKIKENFSKLNTEIITILRWETKLLHELTGKPVDRLAIISTGTNIEQILGISDIPAANGNEIASAIYETLKN